MVEKRFQFPLLGSVYNIAYDQSSDGWRMPKETLQKKMGSCGDMATLLCSMIRHYSQGKVHVECIGIKPADGGGPNHMAVQVQTPNGTIAILDPAGSYCEVSTGIEQAISGYLQHLETHLARKYQVVEAFNDRVHVKFGSLEEYVEWVKGRSG